MNLLANLSITMATLTLLCACAESAGNVTTPTATGDAPFRVGDKPSDVFRMMSSGFTVTFDWHEGSPNGLPGAWVLRQSATTRRWDSMVGRGTPDGGSSTAWSYGDGETHQNASTISCRWGRDKADAGRLNTTCDRRVFPSRLPNTVYVQSLYDLIEERLPDREILGEHVYCWAVPGIFAYTTCVTGDGIPVYFKSPITPGKRGTEWEELVATSITRGPPVMSSADELAARLGTKSNNVAASDLELPEFSPR